jgi:hypothetical protein
MLGWWCSVKTSMTRRVGLGIAIALAMGACTHQPAVNPSESPSTSAPPAQSVPSTPSPHTALPSPHSLLPSNHAAPSRTAAQATSPRTAASSHAGTPPGGGSSTSGSPPPAVGALNSAVTQSTIDSTICVAGWTATIRPPSSYTDKVKQQQLAASGRADQYPSHYEEDHIVPLELGGAPSDPANLRPVALSLAHGDDSLENSLHRAVCDGSISLAAARAEIVHAKLGESAGAGTGGATSRAPSRPPSAPRPTPAPLAPAQTTPPANPGNGATALCRDGTLSYAAHHRGACSHHGGVSVFYR